LNVFSLDLFFICTKFALFWGQKIPSFRSKSGKYDVTNLTQITFLINYNMVIQNL
jgi:hypothetical protein